MAGGKLSARQKMINLMYLVFIAMLAMNMSKEVLSAFGFMNEELTESSRTTSIKNNESYSNLNIKAKDQKEKYGPLKTKSDQIKSLSNDLNVYLDTLKAKITKDIDDLKDYESMDKPDVLDEYFFAGDKLSKKGKEFKDKINSYRDSVVAVLGSADSKLISVINKRFNTDDYKNKDGKKIDWIEYRYKGFPVVASLTNFSQIQGNIKNTESDILSALLGNQLEGDSKLTTNNYKGIVRLEKTAYFSGERVKGQVVLGRYDDQLVPSKVTLGKRDITKNVENGQVLLDMPAGNVGEREFKGVITFMQDGEAQDIPFESSYSVIAEPSEAVISADKMNVVYRGLDNPISISVPGVGDKDITPTVGKGNKLTKTGNGKYILNPGSGKEVTINVSAKLSSGKNIKTPNHFISAFQSIERLENWSLQDLLPALHSHHPIFAIRLEYIQRYQELDDELDTDINVLLNRFMDGLTLDLPSGNTNKRVFTEEVKTYVKVFLEKSGEYPRGTHTINCGIVLRGGI